MNIPNPREPPERTLHRAPVGQGPLGPGWLATALGFWSGRALATGTAWAGLCLIHNHALSRPQSSVVCGDDIGERGRPPVEVGCGDPGCSGDNFRGLKLISRIFVRSRTPKCAGPPSFMCARGHVLVFCVGRQKKRKRRFCVKKCIRQTRMVCLNGGRCGLEFVVGFALWCCGLSRRACVLVLPAT